MKRLIVWLIVILLFLTGCVQKQTDYPAAITADGIIYLKSAAPMPAESIHTILQKRKQHAGFVSCVLLLY